jgi:cytochrome c biogenesis protein CcdA
MTFIFAAGLALIILPVALGAAAIGSLISAHHTIFYLAGGTLMLALGLYMLVGGKLMLPMPAMRARRGSGPLAVLSLGAFSGVASACCAPVLAGVATLSGASGSFSNALILGVGYVFGMVFPLFVIALLWDRFNWGESRLLKGKRFSVPVFGRRLALHSTALASGLILIVMGVVVMVIAFRANAMPSSGWQLSLSAHVQHYAHVLEVWAGTLPGWITGIGVFAALAALGWKALGQFGFNDNGDTEEERDEPLPDSSPPRTTPTMKPEELTLER